MLARARQVARLLESNVPGHQAGTRSRIENYLGFPAGISGVGLAGHAYAQALNVGAHVIVARGAQRLACAGPRYAVQMDDGLRASAHAIIIATGAAYRKPALENLSPFEGAGVYSALVHIRAVGTIKQLDRHVCEVRIENAAGGFTSGRPERWARQLADMPRDRWRCCHGC